MGVRRWDQSMRRTVTYIALCAFIGVCMTATVVVAGVAIVPYAHAASASAQHGHKQSEPTIRLKLVGTSSTPVYTDGMRWAVYEPTVGVTRLMDTVYSTSVTRPDPEGCAGGLLAIGGGEILYACSDPACLHAANACLLVESQRECPPILAVCQNTEIGRWIVEDIVSGAQHPVDIGKGLLPAFSRYGVSLSSLDWIGSQWARGSADMPFFLNWHTGQVIEEKAEPASANLDYENLDSKTLLEPLCRPLTRRRIPPADMQINPVYFGSQYVPPFMTEERADPSAFHGLLYLRRCGSRRGELLSEGFQLGDGVLLGYRRLWRLNPHGRPWLGQSYRLTGPPKPHEAGGLSVSHTSMMVIETIERPATRVEPYRGDVPWNRGPGRFRVWVGRLPWD